MTLVHEYVNRMKRIQSEFLDFIEDENHQNYCDFTIFDFLSKLSSGEKKIELTEILNMLYHISTNHHQTLNFYKKIELIIDNFKDDIKQTFSNIEIFRIFQSNKRIILFLIKQKILLFDKFICDYVINSNEQNYFTYEIISFYSNGQFSLNENNKSEYENFDLKREIGENDSILYKLIRNDSITDFIIYVNQNHISLSRTLIPQSIFETNSFINSISHTLIECAAFFGSVKIFKYLQLNKVELDSSLWLYAIHSKNADIIHILEENHIKPEDKSYKECLIESIKCHHNDIAKYIIDNLIIKYDDIQFEVTNEAIKYYNYEFFPAEYNQFFNSLIQYNYSSLLHILTNKMKCEIVF